MTGVAIFLVAELLLACYEQVSAQPDPVTGNDLLERARALNRVEGSRPQGGDSNTSQWTRVLTRYVETNPAELHKDATSLSLVAFRRAFPCRKL
jgi:hypothetical protein